MATRTIEKTCVDCQKVIPITVDSDKFASWEKGEGHIQDVFPELTDGEREMFITGICDKCFDELFAEEEN